MSGNVWFLPRFDLILWMVLSTSCSWRNLILSYTWKILLCLWIIFAVSFLCRWRPRVVPWLSHCGKCYSERTHWRLKPEDQRHLQGAQLGLLLSLCGTQSPFSSVLGEPCSCLWALQNCCQDPHLLAQLLYTFAQKSLSTMDEFLASQD